MSIKPLKGRVIVERLEAEEKIGSIIIPDNAKEKPMKGKVIAVGKEKDGEESEIKTGDIVVFPKWAGTEFKFNDKEFLIIKIEEIHAIVA